MKNFSILILVVLLVSCGTTKEQIYWVNSSKVDATNVAPEKCIQVQQSDNINSENWEIIYTPIEGFDYQAGYLYKIKVKKEKLKAADVPADASSIKYTLIEVLEKKVDKKLRINDIWVLSKINTKEINTQDFNTTQEIPQIEFKVAAMKVGGSDGCNQFFGSIEFLTEYQLHFGMFGGTKMMCMDMTLADEFLQTLSLVKTYKIENLHLYLYNKSAEEVMVLKKID